MGILELISGKVKEKPHGERKAKCPKCGAEVTLGMDRCPACGTHISSMFRIECPKCKSPNEVNAKFCVKCGYDLSDKKEGAPSGSATYRCPICGYVANYYMLSCPACGVKFV
jgi:hypothetical protein